MRKHSECGRLSQPLMLAVFSLLCVTYYDHADAFGMGIGLRSTTSAAGDLTPTTTSMGMGNSYGRLFRISTWGESHGGGVGVSLDGCPPKIPLSSEDIQVGAW